jgi:hypothetical protein
MRTAFIDKQREELFTKDGYVVVDLIEPDKLEEIKQTFSKLEFEKITE